MSNDVVIRASGVGKQYRLGQAQRYGSLRESLSGALSRILRWSARPGESDFWALQDATFEVRQGDVVGLIGRNGAGKSTLLKILSRITEPTTGEIQLRGRVGSLLEVGTGFHPELTGRENIFLNGAILGMRKAEIAKKFDDIVAFAEVEKFLDTAVKHYSSGMYTRLAFAVAAHLEPEILVVDEVLAVGDSAFQKKCLGKMSAVATEGRTVIFVSHNMGAINRLCRRALWLDRGRIVENGPTSEVVAKYLITDSSDAGQYEWPEGTADPGVEEFRLFSVRIHNQQGDVASVVDVRYPFVLSFDYEFRKRLPYCRVGFVLSTADGTVLFDSYDTDQEAHQGERAAGRYQFRCEIPGHLLLPGAYSISVAAGMPGLKTLLWRENVLSLTVEETAISGDTHAQPVGLIRPKLKWERLAR
jgi:lipopolysaccharide transport system ATP-binding protein